MKKKTHLGLLLGLLLGGLLASTVHAGPWSKGTGHFYVKVGQGFFLAKQFVDEKQVVRDGADFFGTQTSFYTEIGLFYGLQLQGSLAYSYGQITYKTDGSFYRLNGPSDATVGIQWTPPPLQKALGFPMAARLNVKIPMYDSGYLERQVKSQAANFPSLGDGQIDMTLWLSAGGALPKLPVYLYGEIGYRFRTETYVGSGSPKFQMNIPGTPVSFLDNFVFHLQLGWKFWKNSLLTVSLVGIIPLGANEVTKGNVSLGVGLYIPLYKGLAFEASFDPMLWAQSSAKGAAISAGISYNL